MKFYDNTRLKTFKSCPRKFYFRHVRHWVGDGKAAPLVFGGCWHEAMDVIWKNAKSSHDDETLAQMAFLAFLTKWEEEGMKPWKEWTLEETQAISPRTPGVAAEMIYHYIKKRRPYLQTVELLSVEEPFVVPVGRENEMYVGRIDKTFKDNSIGVIIGEHKSTSLYKKGAPFRSDFIDSWSPESQVDGYLHAGHMKHGDSLRYLYIDAALVHKEVHDGFKFIGINRSLEQLDAWLFETHYFMEEIAHNLDSYHSRNWQEKAYLAAFPKNTNACFEYMRPCPYRDICRMVSNPERLEEPPEGMKVEKWEPFDILGLSELGLEPEED